MDTPTRADVRRTLAGTLADWIRAGDWTTLPEPLHNGGRIWPGDDGMHGWLHVDDLLAVGLAQAIKAAAAGAALGDAVRVAGGSAGSDPHRVSYGVSRLMRETGRMTVDNQTKVWTSVQGREAAQIIAEAAPRILAAG